MCISDMIPGEPMQGRGNYRKVEAEINISINCYAIYHLMLNDKIILAET